MQECRNAHFALVHSCILVLSPLHRQLDPSHSKAIAAGNVRARDTFAVDERAVRARKVLDFQFLIARSQTAVQPRHERAIDDEVGTRSPADCLDGAGTEPKRQWAVVRL